MNFFLSFKLAKWVICAAVIYSCVCEFVLLVVDNISLHKIYFKLTFYRDLEAEFYFLFDFVGVVFLLLFIKVGLIWGTDNY